MTTTSSSQKTTNQQQQQQQEFARLFSLQDITATKLIFAKV
jgi:hypothetical protein